MSNAAIFERDGERFVPGPDATGPWGSDRLHGGPVLGLIARAVEAVAPDPELVVTRITLDMFRPVPRAPLAVRVETVRKSARLWLLQVAIEAEDGEVARATALLLRTSEGAGATAELAPPEPPEGLPTESLMRGFRSNRLPPGFHTRVETRWVPRAEDGPRAIWFRLPLPLVRGEAVTSFQCAVALSDFANAVASIAAAERDRDAVPYINTDATLYLSRRPQGEWFCLLEHGRNAERGVGIAETLLFDVRGAFGRALQSRLANRHPR